MNTFWVLDHPDSSDATRRLADWPKDEDLLFRKVDCNVNPEGHRGVRNRITTPLSMLLPDSEPLDFVWTHLGECAVQQPVLEALAERGLTGYDAVPVRAKFKSLNRRPPKLWELAIKGSAGLASPESGLRVLWRCPGCDLTDYSPITDPTKIVDESKWDGSDFFRIEPVSGWIFVTDRVIQTLRRTPLTGWKAYSLSGMKESFDIAVPRRIPPSLTI